MMISERRKMVRRKADMEMAALLEQLQARRQEDPSREVRHMRRRAIRHNCKVQIALRIREQWGSADAWTPTEHPVKGRILDLSAEGCSVFTRQQLDIGQTLSLLIMLRDNSSIRAAGNVRWTKGVKEHDGYAAGVQFANIPDNERRRINAFLKELDETIGM